MIIVDTDRLFKMNAKNIYISYCFIPLLFILISIVTANRVMILGYSLYVYLSLFCSVLAVLFFSITLIVNIFYYYSFSLYLKNSLYASTGLFQSRMNKLNFAMFISTCMGFLFFISSFVLFLLSNLYL